MLDHRTWSTIFRELAGKRPSSGQPPILGFRANRVEWFDDGGVARPCLTSPNRYLRWAPTMNVARCLRHPFEDGHQPPERHCTCGLYALSVPVQTASADLPVLRLNRPLNAMYVGVAATGRVRIHELGWRAQFVRIIAIAEEFPTFWEDQPIKVGTTDPSVAQLLAERYAVELVPLGDLRDAMRRFGDFVEEIK